MNAKILVYLVVLGVALSFAASIGQNLNNICVQVKGMMPLVAFTLIVLGGLVYAIGQVLGAEMRSRTNVWATTMVIGAVLGLIIAFSAPAIVQLAASSFGDEGITEGYEYNCKEII